jgi:hypothetical protein
MTKIAGDPDPDPLVRGMDPRIRTKMSARLAYVVLPDGEGDHGELCEDESCEADGHHVDEFLLEEQQRPEHDDGALVVSPVLFADQGCFITDSEYEFSHPGSRIHIKEFKYFNPKNCFFF